MLDVLLVFFIIAILVTIIMFTLLVSSSKYDENENLRASLSDFTSPEENPTVDDLVKNSEENPIK